jgi:peptidyl-prolyl cis-trans isomerase A (cyclophilin A)
MKKKLIAIFIIVVLLIAIIGIIIYNNNNNKMASKSTKVLLETTDGNIELELYPDKAPITVANFLSYVKDGTYDGTVFHRVIESFMIQGGGFTPDGNQKQTKANITLESNNGLSNDVGTIAMARTSDPNSATDQFFINTANNSFLNYSVRDQGYAVFGKVINGMDVVKKIEESPTTTKYRMSDWPSEDIIITKVTIVQ